MTDFNGPESPGGLNPDSGSPGNCGPHETLQLQVLLRETLNYLQTSARDTNDILPFSDVWTCDIWATIEAITPFHMLIC